VSTVVMTNIKPIFALVTVAAMVGLFIAISNVVIRLEMYHRETWERFGSPKYLPVSLVKQFLFARFVALAEYRKLDDAALNKRAIFARISLFAMIVIIILAPLVARQS
jgi:hypothetical protein